ncbi:hypothetical protein ACFLU8_04015 [Chloroflexota bacterium]
MILWVYHVRIWYSIALWGRKNRRMSMDWLIWVVRAVVIVVGIIMVMGVLKRNKEGIYQGQYYIGIFGIAITGFILGIILLIVSSITDLSSFYSVYLIAVGAIGTIIGLVARNIWKKHR